MPTKEAPTPANKRPKSTAAPNKPLPPIPAAVPKAIPPEPKAIPPVPKAFPPVPTAFPPVPKAFPPVPTAFPPVAKAIPPVPTAIPPVPDAMLPVPQAVPADLPFGEMMSVEGFKELTNQGWFTQKSTAQKRIISLLTEYHKLGHRALEANATKKQKKALAKELQTATNSENIPDSKLKQAQSLLFDMKAAAQLWLKSHTVEDDGMYATRGATPAKGSKDAKKRGTDPQAVKAGSFDETHSQGIVIDGKVVDGTAPTTPGSVLRTNPNRRKRLMGMAAFQVAVEAEQDYLAARFKLAAVSDQDPVVRDELAAKAFEDHYGDFSTFFSKLGVALDTVVPRNGDSASFEVGFKIPIPDTPLMITGDVSLSASREMNGAVSAGVDIKPGIAAGVGAANIAAAIGIYTTATAKNGADIMTLVSYAVYRNLRQSNVPSEVTDKMWGGSTGRFGKLKADKWSRGVEKKMWGDDNDLADDTFLEWGYLAQAGVSAGFKTMGVGAEVGTEAEARFGSRYDKTSMTNRKGGAGEKNLRSDGLFTKYIASQFGRGAEKSLSRRSYTVTVTNSLQIGVFSGELSASVILRQQGLHKEDRQGLTNFNDWVFEEVSFSGKLAAELPGGQMVVAGNMMSQQLLGGLRDKATKLSNQADSRASKELGNTTGATDTAAVLDGLNNGTDILDFATIGSLAAAGTAGIEVEINGAVTKSGDEARQGEFSVDVRLVTGIDIDAAGYLSLKVEKGRRLIGANWDTETRKWTSS